jgi:hypothetical protein
MRLGGNFNDSMDGGDNKAIQKKYCADVEYDFFCTPVSFSIHSNKRLKI